MQPDFGRSAGQPIPNSAKLEDSVMIMGPGYKGAPTRLARQILSATLQLAVLGWLCAGELAADAGRVVGQVLHQNGDAISGVAVFLESSERHATTSEAFGRFALEGMAPSSQILLFVLGEETASETVAVAEGQTNEVERVVDWQFVVLETDRRRCPPAVPKEPALVLATLIIFGEVDNQRTELTLGYALSQDLSLDFCYFWNDLDSKQNLPATPPLVANTPENKFQLGLAFSGDRISAPDCYRWSEPFHWEDGLLSGEVPSYGTVNPDATYRLSNSRQVGLNVSNLLNGLQYELFSGDLLERQVLAHVSLS